MSLNVLDLVKTRDSCQTVLVRVSFRPTSPVCLLRDPHISKMSSLKELSPGNI